MAVTRVLIERYGPKLADYIGQQAVKEQMQIFIEAARQPGESLDHTLMFGPPGLGKTTLANIMAREMGAAIKVHIGASTGKARRSCGDVEQLRCRRRSIY